jgi:hypothetical protein
MKVKLFLLAVLCIFMAPDYSAQADFIRNKRMTGDMCIIKIDTSYVLDGIISTVKAIRHSYGSNLIHNKL